MCCDFMVFEGVVLVRHHTFSDVIRHTFPDVIGCVVPEVPASKNVHVRIEKFSVSERRRLYIPVTLCHWDVFLSC